MTSSLHVNVCREWGRPENGRIACRCASHAAFTPLSSHKTPRGGSERIGSEIQKAIEKLDKYWNMMIKTPAYLMSVVLGGGREFVFVIHT